MNQSGASSDDDPICQEFFVDNTDAQHPVLKEVRNNGSPVALTSTNTQIDLTNPVRFAINGTDGSVSGMGCSDPNQCGIMQCGNLADQCLQPRVTVLLNVKIAGDSENPVRTIQTTVSRRTLNVR